MSSSYNRDRGKKRRTKFAHNETKVVTSNSGSEKRGVKIKNKTLYWDQRSGSWKPTKNKPIGDGLKKDFSKTIYKTKKNYELKKKNVNKESNEKLKIISQARKDGDAPKFGDIRGTEEKPKNTESNKESSNEVTQKQLDAKIKERQLKKKYGEVTQEQLDKKIANPDAKVKDKDKDKLKIGYRRTKGEGVEKKSGGYRGDTRTTAKLKKAGFTETRLAGLRKKNAEFQAAKKDKKKMKAYREKYGKR